MIQHIIRRLLASLLVLFALTLAIFLVFKTIPLEPACLTVNCGQRATVTAAQLRAINHRLGADRPILVQYKEFVWRLLRHGSFGKSWTRGEPIDPQLRRSIGVTGSIVVGGIALLLLLSIPLGVLSALRPNTLLDRAVLFGSIIGIALHPLIIGFLLRQTFGHTLHWLPTGRYCSLHGAPPLPPVPGILEYLKRTHQPLPCGGLGAWTSHLILPWTAFALFFLPLYVRMIRARVLETINEPHVAAARAKGASEVRLLARHVLRLALIPLPPMVALEMGGALMASIYIEVVFALPGIGNLVLETLSPDNVGYDLPVIAAVFFVVAAFIVVLNLLADLMQAALDPRIRLRGTA